MDEFWDIYDEKKKKTGRLFKRGDKWTKNDEYHLVVNALILNKRKEILIDKRASGKKMAGLWEISGGAVKSGETGLDAIIRELGEELGLKVKKEEAILLKELKIEGNVPRFKEVWIFENDIDIKNLVFTDKEVDEAKWVNIEEFKNMVNKKKMVPTIEIDEKDYNYALELLSNK